MQINYYTGYLITISKCFLLKPKLSVATYIQPSVCVYEPLIIKLILLPFNNFCFIEVDAQITRSTFERFFFQITNCSTLCTGTPGFPIHIQVKTEPQGVLFCVMLP